MRELFEPLSGLFYGLTLFDWAIPIGIGLWCLVFLVSINSLDEKNFLIAMMYICICSANAVTLVLAIPQKAYSDGATTFQSEFIYVLIFMSVASLKWVLHYRVKTKARPSKAHRKMGDITE